MVRFKLLFSILREVEEEDTTTTVDLLGKGGRVNQKTQFLRSKMGSKDNH